MPDKFNGLIILKHFLTDCSNNYIFVYSKYLISTAHYKKQYTADQGNIRGNIDGTRTLH